MKFKLSYIFYLFSCLVVFPLSLPVYLIIGFMTDSLESGHAIDLMFFGFLAFITIFGSIVLNFIFRFASFDKNNKFTWSIFIAHLILIPLSVYIYSDLFFR
ncbi:hypothetical protein ACFCYN_22590 [Gottfriedia sp. NPDC056225]|uniref:hypothetical protein n=1 Tax=Gottfriedia sp. NPDC056225 TaxID=3345751 RepID=UPI0015591701|nr:hypothetical protein HPK19_04235 [Arthrobacter citreus]